MLVESNPVAIVFFLFLAALSMKLSKDLLGSWLAAPGLFGGVWFISLAVFYSGIVSYYALRPKTLGVFVATTVVFICGCLLGKCLYGLPIARSIKPIDRSSIEGLQHADSLICVLFLIGVWGTLSYYLLMHQVIGIDSLWRDPILVRYEEVYGRLRNAGWGGVARSFAIPCFILCSIYLKIRGSKAPRRFWAILIVTFLLLLPSSGRTTMGTMLVATFLGIQYVDMGRRGRMSYKHTALIAGVVLLFVGYFLLTTNLLSKSVSDRAGIADLSFYLVSGFPAFQQMVLFPQGYEGSGHITFGVITRILYAFDPENVIKPDYVRPFTTVPFPTNIYTYLDSAFLEYGWIGIFILPFFLGLALTILYLSLNKKPSVLKFFMNALLGTCIVQSLGVNRFGATDIWMWMVVLAIIQTALKLGFRLPCSNRMHGPDPDMRMS